MDKYRDDEKMEAALKRGGFLDHWPLCDLCHEKEGSQMHELIPRAMTMNNQEARELSYQRELVSLLCQECHDRAHEEAVKETLWQFNITLWGREDVEEAWQQVQNKMSTPLISYL